MTSASQSASSSSMSGKSDVQSVPNDIAQDLADVLDNSKSTFVAVWQMDCACLSKVVPGLKMDRVKSLLAGIAMDSIRFENDVTVFAIDFMKSVFGRDMMRSFRSVFAIIQTERLLYAEVDYLFIRFPKQFMFLGRLIGRNMLRVKAAIEQIIDDDGFPIFDKEVDFEFYPEPVRVEFSDALFEQFSELTHEVAEAEVKKSRKNISLCRFKRKREVSSSRDERESQRRKRDEGTVGRSSNSTISNGSNNSTNNSTNSTHNITHNSTKLVHRGTRLHEVTERRAHLQAIRGFQHRKEFIKSELETKEFSRNAREKLFDDLEDCNRNLKGYFRDGRPTVELDAEIEDCNEKLFFQ
eukprot:157233_1